MKKVFIAILMMLMLCGCSDDKPTEWDISKDRTWEVWASGELIRIGTMRNPDCTNNKEYCSNHAPVQSYVFSDGRAIAVLNISDPGNVRTGQSGKLYKYSTGKADHISWFQWIIDGTVATSTAKKEIKSELIEYNEIPKASQAPQMYSWKSYSTSKPQKYQIVLVKLANGIITTGHLNHINEFKLEANRDVEDNGRTITNVVLWKKVNLN